MSGIPTFATPPSSRRPRRSTTYAIIGRLQALTTSGADSLGLNDCLLDIAAANCSMVPPLRPAQKSPSYAVEADGGAYVQDVEEGFVSDHRAVGRCVQ